MKLKDIIKSIVIRPSEDGNRKLASAQQFRALGLVIPAALSALALNSCVIDDLHYTPHPYQGAVEVTVDFSGRSSDSQLPDSYKLRIGGAEQTVSGTTNVFGQLFNPGDYTLLVYNEPSGITVTGTTAKVEVLPDGMLNSSLGFLFSGSQQITVPADDTLHVTQVMNQLTRTLVLRLDLSEEDANRLKDIEATLSGIVSYADIATGELGFNFPGTIAPGFELKYETLADGTIQWYIEATVVLLGVAENASQILSITVTLDSGYTAVIEDDISDDLDDFNGGGGGSGTGGGKAPIEMDTDIQLPQEAGISGSIGDWTVVDNGNIEIH